MKRPLFLILTFLALGISGVALARIAPSIGGGNGSASGTGNWPPSGTPADLLDGDQTGGSGASGIVTSTIAVYQATLFHTFQTAGSTKVVIANDGSVGIGTTNPASALDVNGTVTATTLNGNLAANKVQAGALGASVMVSSIANTIVTSDTIKDGTIGLTDMQSSIVLSSDTTGVTPGTYSNATVTVDRNGRVWAASVGSVSGSTYTGTFSGSGATFSTLSVTGSGSLSVTGGVATLNILGGGSGVSPLELFQDGVGRSSPTASIKIGSNLTLTLNGSSPTLSATGGSGVSDNLGNHVATMPIVSPYAVTVASGTVYGQLSVGSITVNSAGAGVINSTHAVIKIKVTDLSDDDFEVAEDSVSVNGVRVSTYQPNTSAVLANHSLDATANGNVISFRDQDRFTSPSFASGTFVTYIATPTMGISSSTIGHFQFHNAISSQANFAVYAWIPPSDIDLTANIILSSFGVILGGADTGTQRYVMAISTSMDGRPARETMFSSPYSWLEGITVDVAADAAGANGYLQVVGNTTLTNWQTRIIPGALHYITVARDGDAAQDGSTVDSYSSFFSVSYKRRLAQ